MVKQFKWRLLYYLLPLNMFFFHRVPECVSERLLEGALVCGAWRKLVPAQEPWGPAAPSHCGAPQSGRGGSRWPWPQTSILLPHPAGRQRTGIFRGTALWYRRILNNFSWQGKCNVGRSSLFFVNAKKFVQRDDTP